MNTRIAFIVALLLAAASPATAAPAISVPVTQFDFGTVVDGTEVVHEFLIRNTGNSLLRVKQINTG